MEDHGDGSLGPAATNLLAKLARFDAAAVDSANTDTYTTFVLEAPSAKRAGRAVMASPCPPAIGAGVHPDVATAPGSWSAFETTLDPDPETHSRYRELYEEWTRVYDAQLALVEAGLLKPSWRAAGT